MIADSWPAVALFFFLGALFGFLAWHLVWWRSRGKAFFTESDRLKAAAAREATRAEDLSAKVDYLVAEHQKLEADIELREIERQRLVELAARPKAVAELEDEDGRAHRIEIHVTDTTIDLRDESNLQRIEGIGPQIADVLRNAGIDSIHELAVANPAYLTRVLEEAGPRFRMHDPSSWPEQARALNGAAPG